jgi:RimJ/RimL family protein N-acetyltransferase
MSAIQNQLGPVVDATPARKPQAVRLEGRITALEKLDPARHSLDLWAGVKDDDTIWDYLAYGPFPDAGTFANWLVERAKLEDPFYFTVLDIESGRALGLITLMRIDPPNRVIETGHIVYGTSLKRTIHATEAQYLLARYVFEQLGNRRFEWKTNTLNSASRRAALRLGFTFEGVFRQHVIVKGRNRDTAWFSMLDSEWPRVRSAYEIWLKPENFESGRQIRSLEEIRQGISS